MYDYTDVDGKKHYKSFTAPSRNMALLAAAEWQANKDSQKNTPENLTVYDAIGKYIQTKQGVLSPATVREYQGTQARYFKVTLPQKEKPELYCPNDNDIRELLEHVRGKELEIAVLLAAFGPLRRSEICALTDTDIRGNTVSVSKAMVASPDGGRVIKNHPKSYGGYRTIEMPDFVINRISRN